MRIEAHTTTSQLAQLHRRGLPPARDRSHPSTIICSISSNTASPSGRSEAGSELSRWRFRAELVAAECKSRREQYYCDTGRSAHPLASSLQRSASRRVRVVCPASWTHPRRSRCRKPGARRRGKVAPARGRVGGILAARCEGGVTKVVRCWRRARNGRSSMQSKRSLLVSPTTRSSVRNLCSSTSAAAAMAP